MKHAMRWRGRGYDMIKVVAAKYNKNAELTNLSLGGSRRGLAINLTRVETLAYAKAVGFTINPWLCGLEDYK